jgi:hypothetical protein
VQDGEDNNKRLQLNEKKILTVTGVDEVWACVVAGEGGGGGGEGGAELLTVGDVGFAEDGPAAVPEGFPFWM